MSMLQLSKLPNKLLTSCAALDGVARRLAGEREFITQWTKLHTYYCSNSLLLVYLFYLLVFALSIM